MARPRSIQQDDILDAAEAVVAREGAARLTLDAVAAEAGISKGSVIYDYRGKEALVRAVIERRVAAERGRLQAAAERLADAPDALIRGRIATAAEAVGDHTQAVSLSLCSAVAQDAEIRDLLREMVAQDLAAMLAQSLRPRNALLAFLAVEGLRFFEMLGIHSWPAEERVRIVADIERLLAVELGPPEGGG